MTAPSLRQVIERHRDFLLGIQGVHGVAAGLCEDQPGRPCVTVYADENTEGIPSELDGVPVEVRTTSGFTAQ